MPLDDDAHAYLEARAALDAPAPWDASIDDLRHADREAWRKVPRHEVPEVRDLEVPGPVGGVPVRVYLPDADGPCPLLVLYHGGGFVFGDVETHDPTARRLCAEAGMAVVSVDYRLAPEHPFPAAVDDAEAATLWAIAHAASIGADPDRVVVSGDSAGGNLAAVVARRLRDAGGPALRGQALIYPVTDMRPGDAHPSRRALADGYGLTGEAMDWFARQYLSDPADVHHPDASPLVVPDLAGLPPAFVATAEYDPLRDEGDAYARRLAAAGVPVEQIMLPGAIHGVQTIPERLRSGEALWARTFAWLARVAGGSKAG